MVSGSNVRAFLAQLMRPGGVGKVFYIHLQLNAANAAYEGENSQSGLHFYEQQPDGSLVLSSATGPAAGQQISLGQVYLQRAMAGHAVGLKGGPDAPLETSLARTLSHELAHAVQYPTVATRPRSEATARPRMRLKTGNPGADCSAPGSPGLHLDERS
jgi:hypothetical protein